MFLEMVLLIKVTTSLIVLILQVLTNSLHVKYIKLNIGTPLSGLLKCNRDASKSIVDQATAISYVYRDSKGHTIHAAGRKIGNLLVVMAGMLTIWNVLKWLF